MPTYEYLCGGCEHKFEEFQSITAKPLKKCPQCGKPKLQRLIGTGAGIIFKGSGFYQTDYRSDSYKAAAKADNSSSSTSTASSSSSSDSKSSSTTTTSTTKSETKSSAKKASS